LARLENGVPEPLHWSSRINRSSPCQWTIFFSGLTPPRHDLSFSSRKSSLFKAEEAYRGKILFHYSRSIHQLKCPPRTGLSISASTCQHNSSKVCPDSSHPTIPTSQLTTREAIIITSSLKVVYEAKVDFDADLSKYGIKKGVFSNEAEREVYAPVAMWLEAVDLVLQRLAEKGTPFEQIKGISGAGQQHGSVYWRLSGEQLLGNLKPDESLVDQLKEAFAHPFSPNWQDASTQKECDAFDAALGSEEWLADVTGSKAHHVSVQHLSR